MVVFGPVPSRRLGRSLGVNNVAPKSCSYSCVYCQVGHASGKRIERSSWVDPARVVAEVRERAGAATEEGDRVDYVSFVPDGEPTLDQGLGVVLEQIRALGLRTAVISNGSLLWRRAVRDDLAKADWISLKVDAAEIPVWMRINRPHRGLALDTIHRAMVELASGFEGELTTETMLVDGLNDDDGEVRRIAGRLSELRPRRAYISVPIRPPASSWVRVPSEEAVTHAYEVFSDHVEAVECLTGYEGDAFASTGDVARDLLDITAVHPMRERAVGALLERRGSTWEVVDDLVAQGLLVRIRHGGHSFLVRRFRHGDQK